MELKKETIKHKSGGLSNVTAFGLDASSASTIIGMLTRQYSDPEMAFIRETSSNAYDAHIAAGTVDKPFDIHIPTQFAPHVEIRDYGTGLSKDFMLNKYTQVGHSTKRKSNSQIGGFGIGRLSFLIVTEQAAITSYHNGRKASYTVNYDADGQLLIALTDERETTEPNGLRLKFPVQTNRVRAFQVAAEKYFSRVSATLPNFSGEKLDITPPAYAHKTDRWGVRTNGSTGIVYAVMGNIAYPVKTDTLKYDSKFNDVRSLLDSRLDLFFEIGEVIPVPTRENLDMCEQTMNGLLKALTDAKTELVTTLENQISGSANRWQAYKAWNAMYSAASYEFMGVLRGLDLKYKGESVYTMKFNFDNVVKMILDPKASKDPKDLSYGKQMAVKQLTFHARRESNWNSSSKFSWSKGIIHVPSNHTNFLKHVFIYNDVKKGIRPTIDHNLPNKDTFINLVSGPKEAWDKFMAREIERGVNPKAFRYASKLLPKPKMAKVKPTNVQIDYLSPRHKNLYSTLWGSFCYARDISNFTGTQYYVKASNFEVDDDTLKLYEKLQGYIRLGLLEPIEILVINKKNVEFIQDDWEPLVNYVKVNPKKVKKKKKQVKIALYLAMKRAYLSDILSDNFQDHMLRSSTRRWNDIAQMRVTKYRDTSHGALLKDNRDVLLAVEDMRYQVSKLDVQIRALGAKKPLEEFSRQVLNRNGWIEDKVYQTLADSYELDYQALRDAATADSRGMSITVDYINSQVYYVVGQLGGRVQFDLNKLKKELSK